MSKLIDIFLWMKFLTFNKKLLLLVIVLFFRILFLFLIACSIFEKKILFHGKYYCSKQIKELFIEYVYDLWFMLLFFFDEWMNEWIKRCLTFRLIQIDPDLEFEYFLYVGKSALDDDADWRVKLRTMES